MSGSNLNYLTVQNPKKLGQVNPTIARETSIAYTGTLVSEKDLNQSLALVQSEVLNRLTLDSLKASFISHQSDLRQFPFQSHSSVACIIRADTSRAIRAFRHACSKRFEGVPARSTRGHLKFSVCFWISNFLLDLSDSTKLNQTALKVLKIFKVEH